MKKPTIKITSRGLARAAEKNRLVGVWNASDKCFHFGRLKRYSPQGEYRLTSRFNESEIPMNHGDEVRVIYDSRHLYRTFRYAK